jgi:hypothetical protein
MNDPIAKSIDGNGECVEWCLKRSVQFVNHKISFDGNCKLCPKLSIKCIWYPTIGKSQLGVPQHGMARHANKLNYSDEDDCVWLFEIADSR